MMSWSQDLAQLLHKVADHDGFGQKAGHAAFQGIAAVFIECVGSHGKDRDLCQCRVAQCADLPGIVRACEQGVLDAEVVLMVCDKPGAKVSIYEKVGAKSRMGLYQSYIEWQRKNL